ncbi:serrate RNA effector molecule-like isoform X1 [Telopea speciosissima]|uniref:serrate RNA effector molecule-like isoform X1 n=1 Tax=Telopea speciosissima TaxID=54955 RepID=UPI001CC6609E|nr:serrate RNA effector molecule-like isoform X1 [Telopea speciosissima]
MAEVMNMPVESLDRRRDRQSERKEKPDDEPPLPPPPPPPRRRDRDSRERRDDRDIDHRRRSDYHDRNRSPPPKERERDYKRRSSPSPPPYRDRRHSPPRRSPPPPSFKRMRRDDGYDRRRGSPRGVGFGPEDRRFGHDYAGGYERGGGRLGYADERPHGRYMNRSSGGYQGGPSDWDSGRGGHGDASNSGSTQREGFMSYKQFIQELEDDILPAEAERRYQEYRSEYISTQKRAYFDAHKDEDWLRDKYHPTNLLSVIERRNENARKIIKDFLLDLQSGTLDLGPGINVASSNKSGQASDPNSEDEADAGGKRRRHGRGPAKENDLLAAPKAHPVSSEPRRIQADIEQALALVRKLDREKGIEENILCTADNDKMDGEKSHGGSMGPIIIIRGLTSVKGLEGIELLDTLLTYLWRIHGLDYYGMTETNEAKGLRHVRTEGKSQDETSAAGAEWENKHDSFWQGRLQGQDPLEIMTAKEKIDAAAVEALDPCVRKIRDEKYGWKYGCGAKGCTKLFHAAEFVYKHLRLKHPELVMELTAKVREDLYFQNYMNDVDAPGGQPVMQQPQLKEKLPPPRRAGLENRLRDDRGNRREHDRADINGDERYDRAENSPSRDFQSNAGGLEGGNPDEPMYDVYGGQGMRAAPPFPSDIPPPPPVLMPVPGAGPLGPFVPAPPEVAMRMLREQGGPSPYEGSGRKGRSGPQVGGPAPILAMSPAFRQDPRRIRSYQDLDAPEDEVTVIDYRSL